MLTLLKKTCIILIGFTAISDCVFSQTSEDHRDFISKLYVDFTGVKPAQSILELTISDFNRATTLAEQRAKIRGLLQLNLFGSSFFTRRLKNYFNSVFGVTEKDGYVQRTCDTSITQDCIPAADEKVTALDFKDEIAATLAKAIASGNRSVTSGISGNNLSDVRDIRLALTSTFTAITPRMATALKSAPLRTRLGLSKADIPDLDRIAAITQKDSWEWWNRDTEGTGTVTGTDGYSEVHSGILTSPAYLLRNKNHLARAYAFSSWFMCKDIAQISTEATDDFKLIQKKPCSDCHSQIEPLGSFWVHWRARIDPTQVAADWVLDGVSRKMNGNLNELPSSGLIPIDSDTVMTSRHSRKVNGTYREHSGVGVKSLGRYIAEENSVDFSLCMTKHMWQFMQGRKLRSDEQGWLKILSDRLRNEHSWDLRETLVDISMTKAYFRSGETQP